MNSHSNVFSDFCYKWGLKDENEDYSVNFIYPITQKFNFSVEELSLMINSEHVPLYKKFYDLLFNEFKAGTKYFVLEAQSIDSGLMIDFDIYKSTVKKVILDVNMFSITEIIVDVLKKNLDFPKNFEIIVFILGHETEEKCEKIVDGKEQEVFKEGYHWHIPGIKIEKTLKKYIYSLIMPILEENIFKKKDFCKELGFYDPNSPNVQVEIYGTVRPKKKSAMKILKSFRILNEIENFDIPKDFNYCLELSLIYEGKYVKKKVFKNIYKFKVLEVEDKELLKIEYEKQRISKNVEKICEIDSKAKYVCEIVNLFKKNRGLVVENSGQKAEWSDIVQTILTINEDYSCIAAIFILRCNGELTKEIINRISDIIGYVRQQNISNGPEVKEICFNKLRGIAKKDNPEAYEDLKSTSLKGRIKEILKRRIIDSVTETDLAIIIGELYKGKFYFIPEENRARATAGVIAGYWIFYVTETLAKEKKNLKPFIYKFYKTYDMPKQLDNIISVEFRKELGEIFHELEKFVSELDEKEQKNFKSSFMKIASAYRFCGQSANIKKISERLRANFLQDSNMAFALDKSEKHKSILGVGNGLLVFDRITGEFELIEDNNYKITRTTKTFYIPFEELEEKQLKEFMGLINDILPIELERDCILMALSQSIIEDDASRYMHFWISNGSSGKSLLCFLMHNALGVKGSALYGENYGYSSKISPDIFMKEKNDPNGADNHLVNIDEMRFVSASEGSEKPIKSHIFKRIKDQTPYRALYGINKVTNFPGIIVIPFNHEPQFDKFDYGTDRRIFYAEFRAKFVSPVKIDDELKTNKYAKIENTEFLEKAKKDKYYGIMWLSLMVKMRKELHVKYNGQLDKIMKKSGLMDQLKQFILRHNHIENYINECVVEDENTITVAEFCIYYANWLKENFGIKNSTPLSYISTVVNSSLGKKIHDLNNQKVIKGISIQKNNLIID